MRNLQLRPVDPMFTRALLGLALCILIVYGLERSLPSGDLRDFGSFIGSGLLAANGQDPYGIHPLTFRVVAPGFDLWNPNLNPPVSVLMFQWLGGLAPPARAFRYWWSVSLLCYLLTIGLLVRRYGAGEGWLRPLWALALAGAWDTLVLGQIYLPLVLVAVAAWLMLENDRHVAAGVMIGILIAFKPNFAVWPALLLLAGHTPAALVAAATGAILSAVPLITNGIDIYHQWLRLTLSNGSRSAFLTNASIPGLAQRMDAGWLGLALGAALLAALALLAVRRKPAPVQASALGILGGIAASPIAWVHYTLFLLPILFASRFSLPLLAAAALLTIPVPVVLHFLDAPLWQQLTAGSAYNWAVLLCLAAWLIQPGSGLLRAEVTTEHRDRSLPMQSARGNAAQLFHP